MKPTGRDEAGRNNAAEYHERHELVDGAGRGRGCAGVGVGHEDAGRDEAGADEREEWRARNRSGCTTGAPADARSEDDHRGPEDDEIEDLQPTELTPAQLADEVRHRVVRGVHQAVDEEDQDKEWGSDCTGEEREAGEWGAAGSHASSAFAAGPALVSSSARSSRPSQIAQIG